MAVNFPDSPANGDSFSVNDTTYVYNATAGYWDITSTVQASASTSTNAPSNPSSGDLWFDPSSLTTYIYYSDGTSSQWVPANSVGARGAPGPGYPTAYYSVDYTSTATGNVVFNSSSSPTLPSYTVGKVNAWVNGVLRSDMDASDGSNVEISLSTGDEVQIINFGDTDILDPTASSNDHTTYTTLSSLIDTVQANVTSAGSGVAVYATPDLLPLSGTDAGDQAYVNSTNRLYINNGAGWYSIGLVNSSPSITSVLDGDSNATPFTLSTDGSASVITITATDPEDVPLTYTYSVTGGSLTNGGGTTATIVQGTGSNTNKFTVTPSTIEAYAGTFSLTFTASDGINTATSANSFTLQFITIVSNSKYTTLLATATGTSDNNNITDASTNNHSITVNGDAYAGTFSPYRSGGYSTSFDGTGNTWFKFPTSTDFNLTDQSFHIGFWCYPKVLGDYDTIIAQIGTMGIELLSGSMRMWLGTGTNGTWNLLNAAQISNTLNVNEWAYITVVRDTDNNTLKSYHNGTLVYNNTSFTGTVGDSTNSMDIGKYNNSNINSWNGYIRDLRYRVGTGSEDTSNAVPTEAVTSEDSLTKLLTCHSPIISDGSSSARTPEGKMISGSMTAGWKVTEPFSPYDYTEYSATDHGGSVHYDGSNDDITITDHSAFDLSTVNWTVEFWWNPKSVNTNEGPMSVGYGSGSTPTGLKFSWENNKLYAFSMDGSTLQTGLYHDATAASLINRWNHVAAVYNGTNTDLYLNGVASGRAQSTNFGENSSDDVRIGSVRRLSSIHYSECSISDVRIVKGTAVYSGNFTPPTGPLTTTGGTYPSTTNVNTSITASNTSLLIKGTDASIIDKSQVNNLKLIGGPAGSTTQAKFSNTKSIDFGDGSLSYVMEVPSGAGYTGEFTIEFWMYNTFVTSTWQSLISNSYVNGSEYFRFYKNNGSGTFALYHNSTSAKLTGIGNITNNTWTHVAIVRDSSNDITVYQDGTSIGSYNNNQIFGTASNPINVGKGGVGDTTNYPMSGYIQDLRITDGLARYTANFTPPTAPLEG